MAICRGSLELWRAVRHHLPARPAVLEIGQGNWFGDVDPSTVPELAGPLNRGVQWDSFDLARAFYKAFLDYSRLVSIDRNGKGAWEWDLNDPLPAIDRFDIVINTGTMEHVFDQRQVFETVHDFTIQDGLMVHAFPVAGCTNHGFYTYSPCLIAAVAEANAYELLALIESRMGGDVLAHLAWRKTKDEPFVVPQQHGSKGIMGGEFTRETGGIPCHSPA